MGKITVKHYLNTDLKPIQGRYAKEDHYLQYGEEEDLFYPLYVQITVNRKTTRLKSRILNYRAFSRKRPLFIKKDSDFEITDFDFEYSYFTAQEFESFFNKDSKYKVFLDEETAIIKDIFNYTRLHEQEKFDIKMFKSHFDSWIKPFWKEVDRVCKSKLGSALLMSEDYSVLCTLSNSDFPFYSIFKALDNISKSSQSSHFITDFNEFLHKEAGYIWVLMQLFDEYTQEDENLSTFYWKENGHQKKFEKFIDSKDLPLEIKEKIDDALISLELSI